MILCYGKPHIPDDVTSIMMACFTREEDVENFYIGKSLETINGRSSGNIRYCF